MGLFHKNLDDAKKAIKKGDITQAKKIIQKHINYLQRVFEENLGKLRDRYDLHWMESRDTLSSLNKGAQKESLEHLNIAIRKLKEMERIIRKLFEEIKGEE